MKMLSLPGRRHVVKISKKKYRVAIQTAEYFAEQRGFRLGYEAALRGEKHQWFSTVDTSLTLMEMANDSVEEEVESS